MGGESRGDCRVTSDRDVRVKKMRWVPPGTFAMGSEEFYPEERPVHRVQLDGFWVDEHPVTVAEFRKFVKATVCDVGRAQARFGGLSRRGSSVVGARLAGFPRYERAE